MIRSLFFTIFFLIILPFSSKAAVLYLEPAESDYYQGDTFVIDVRIDAEEECVNTIKADLEFPKNSLEVKDVSKGNSIISFWVKEPEFSNETGFISFAGGIPGGFCGILPGDPGESNLLGKIIFKVREIEPLKEARPLKIQFLGTSQVLLNDGLGTLANLSFKKAVLTILAGISETPRQEWQEELEKDKVSPEAFKIEIHQEPSIFEGKYFITFYTADKQTGVDYYEVKEGKKDWKRTESPYVLENQGLNYIIKVRAIDKAGNERIAEYSPAGKLFLRWLLVILPAMAIIWLAVRKLKKKNAKL